MVDQDHRARLARLGHLYNLEYEMVRATATFEHAALQPLFFLNGGALVATLTLYGALSNRTSTDFGTLRMAILGWIVGLVLASAAAFLGALSQFSFRKLRSTEVALFEKALGINPDELRNETVLNRDIGAHAGAGRLYRRAAVVSGVASLLAFVVSLAPAFASFGG